jgi:hypothetical protein
MSSTSSPATRVARATATTGAAGVPGADGASVVVAADGGLAAPVELVADAVAALVGVAVALVAFAPAPAAVRADLATAIAVPAGLADPRQARGTVGWSRARRAAAVRGVIGVGAPHVRARPDLDRVAIVTGTDVVLVVLLVPVAAAVLEGPDGVLPAVRAAAALVAVAVRAAALVAVAVRAAAALVAVAVRAAAVRVAAAVQVAADGAFRVAAALGADAVRVVVAAVQATALGATTRVGRWRSLSRRRLKHRPCPWRLRARRIPAARPTSSGLGFPERALGYGVSQVVSTWAEPVTSLLFCEEQLLTQSLLPPRS